MNTHDPINIRRIPSHKEMRLIFIYLAQLRESSADVFSFYCLNLVRCFLHVTMFFLQAQARLDIVLNSDVRWHPGLLSPIGLGSVDNTYRA